MLAQIEDEYSLVKLGASLSKDEFSELEKSTEIEPLQRLTLSIPYHFKNKNFDAVAELFLNLDLASSFWDSRYLTAILQASD